ncbi:MAG: hypothetical protein ACEQSR_08560 [Candidatus Methylacidiphilales bacterium]
MNEKFAQNWVATESHENKFFNFKFITMPVNNPPLFTNFCGCAPRQADQFLIFGDNVPNMRNLGSSSFLQFLTSKANKGILSIQQALTKANGKRTNLVITMEEPICPTFCRSSVNCNTTYAAVKGGISCFDISLNDPIHLCDGTDPAALIFKKADWKKYCDEEDDSRLQKQMFEVNKKLIEAVDKAMVKELNDLVPASQTHKLPFYIQNTNGFPTLNPLLISDFEQFLRDGGYDGDYVLFGGQELNRLMQHLKIASASSIGYDATKGGAYPPMYYDRNFDTEFPNAIVAIPYKAIQFVSFNEFEGQGGQDIDNIIKDGTTVYPLGNGSSLKLDFRWEHEYRCHEYRYDPRLFAELFAAPRGGCGIDTEFNGVLVFENCSNSALPACP